jgi:hypothetical protein
VRRRKESRTGLRAPRFGTRLFARNGWLSFEKASVALVRAVLLTVSSSGTRQRSGRTFGRRGRRDAIWEQRANFGLLPLLVLQLCIR